VHLDVSKHRDVEGGGRWKKEGTNNNIRGERSGEARKMGI
jgi:hypothetical protein